MECVGQIEIDPFCQKILAKHWPNVKRMEDIKNVRGDEFGTVDLVCGGFPCQPFSCAGKRKGKSDDRYLWPEMLRIIKTAGPSWIIVENVAGIISMELDKVLFDLESIGCQMQTFIIPACAVDAPHRRDRVWIIAHSTNTRVKKMYQWEKCADEILSDSNIQRLEGKESTGESGWKSGLSTQCSIWPTESGICRVSNGIPHRMDRLKTLGNAVVPQIVEIIGRAIMEIEDEKTTRSNGQVS
jgi:DNA (cytosine-5)-methyltransferase 1